MRFLKDEKGFKPDDPIFPAPAMGHDENRLFTVIGFSRDHWSSGQQIRKIMRSAFERAGLNVPTPHAFRHMLIRFGEERTGNTHELKVWSKNIGHDSLATTLGAYAHVSDEETASIMRRLRQTISVTSDTDRSGPPDPKTINWVLDHRRQYDCSNP